MFTSSHARQSVGDEQLNPRSGERGYDSYQYADLYVAATENSFRLAKPAKEYSAEDKHNTATQFFMLAHAATDNRDALVPRRRLILWLEESRFSPTDRRNYVDEPLRRLAFNPRS